MPGTTEPKAEEVNLLTALQTSFSKDSDPEKFLAHARDQITEIDRVIIDTCARNRIRIDDNLYALLESRDAIAEQQQEVESVTTSASEITRNVDQAVKVLNEKIQVSRNLDAALSVAAQTRKLTRMYARIEDTIDSRRLYTAFRMLKVLEEETQIAKPGTFLQELVPDTHRLRATITLHARKYFHAWLDSTGIAEPALGSYAVQQAERQVARKRKLQTPVTSAAINEQESTRSNRDGPEPGESVLHENPLETQHKPWLPLLTSQAPASAAVLSRSQTPHSYSSHGSINTTPRTTGVAADQNPQAETVGDAQTGIPAVRDNPNEAPMLYLRPLLQSTLVNEGLELIGEMRTEYRRERYLHLRKILDKLKVTGELARHAAQAEALVLQLCGFFIVEKAAQLHARPALTQKSTIESEWWLPAYQQVVTYLKPLCESPSASPSYTASVRSLLSRLHRFAIVYELPI